MKADCQCIEGSIGKVDKIDLIFDYAIGGSEKLDPIQGSAELTLYDFQAFFRVTPEMTKTGDDSVSLHEQGMLHLKLDNINMSAFDFPVRIRGSDQKEAVKAALSALLERFLSSDEPIDAKQTEFIDKVINESFISYQQHMPLYDQTLEIDYQLVGPGVHVSDDYFSMVMDGTFHSLLSDADAEQIIEEEESGHDYGRELPYYQEDRGPV